MPIILSAWGIGILHEMDRRKIILMNAGVRC
jgi:hypothetical protein